MGFIPPALCLVSDRYFPQRLAGDFPDPDKIFVQPIPILHSERRASLSHSPNEQVGHTHRFLGPLVHLLPKSHDFGDLAMNRKVASILIAIAVLLALYPAVRLATAQPKTPASLLFVQTAQKIDYKDGVMTLYDVPAQTMFFTDRPNRVVGNLQTSAFVSKWTTDKTPNGFATVPPNAAVTVFEPGGAKTAIVELTNPRLDGNNLSYNVKVLQGIGSTQAAAGVLFIDNFSYASWAQSAFAPPG
jgi:hypothetical protein